MEAEEKTPVSRQCPKCHQPTLQYRPSAHLLWCRSVACNYHAMVDAEKAAEALNEIDLGKELELVYERRAHAA